MSRLKLNEQLLETVKKWITEGNYVTTACQSVGISKATFYNWMGKGEKATGGLFRKFYEAVQEATAKAEQKYVGVITDAANKGTWYAAAWWLERRYPDRWGRRERLDVTSGGKPIGLVDVKKLTDDELETLEKILGGKTIAAPQPDGNTGGESQA